MPHPNHLTLSLAGTAAVALASLPFGITPANAAKVSEGTTSSIGVVEDASNVQKFNLKPQSASPELVARRVVGCSPCNGGRGGLVSTGGLPAFLQQLLNYLLPGLPGYNFPIN